MTTSGESTVYLDHAATTPLRPEVLASMTPYLLEHFGNPSSTHRAGRTARQALEEARERVAAALGASREEIVFTSGGTEADNLAVLGMWRASTGRAVVCSAIEHSAVIAAATAAVQDGAELVVLAVDEDGVIQLEAVDEALGMRPAIVSIMWGNNEIGVVQPIGEVAERCHERGTPFHTDAVQAVGKVDVRVDRVPVDLLSLSAHKIGGPKGVGALYVRAGVEIVPLVYGGGQQRGIRPGTENVAGAVGLATAIECAVGEREREAERLAHLRDALEAGLQREIPDIVFHGGRGPRLPHITNVAVPEVDQEGLIFGLDVEGVAVSSGSACHSGATTPSHVLLAIGAADASVATVRFSLGRTTTEAEIEEAVQKFAQVVDRGRAAPVEH